MVYNIDWKDKAVEHIARHHIEKFEVEEGINDDDPKSQNGEKSVKSSCVKRFLEDIW